MIKYTLVLISVDGKEFRTDGNFETLPEAKDYLNNLGSRWYFYPFAAIIRKPKASNYSSYTITQLQDILKSKIIFISDDFDSLNGKTVATYIKLIKEEIIKAY
jgi:hypothetical protein